MPGPQLERLSDTALTLAPGETDIRNKTVVDEAGEEIGSVDALYIDPEAEEVRLVEIKYGDFLGLGGKSTLLPVEAITSVDDVVRVGHRRDRVAGAPTYAPELRVATADDYYLYYGYPAYGGGLPGASFHPAGVGRVPPPTR